ncbi:MAG: DUF2007 domain-containing protein [Flavobacteriaceae bacterium]|nr:DUF2007 domain-containing protein [Flavobacteriaceae bacterium]MDZ4148059.1 DUF2007 domain-containing protein [Flavobacteriaceae bacterium]
MKTSKDYQHLYAGSTVLCLGLKNALQARGIIAVTKDEFESARLGGFGSFSDLQDLFVRTDEMEVATEVKNAFLKELME